MKDDPYKILGVGQGATAEEIKVAYLLAARKYHPDSGGDAWVFQQVQEAYAALQSERGENRAGSAPQENATAQNPPRPKGTDNAALKPRDREPRDREPRGRESRGIAGASGLELFRLRLKDFFDHAFKRELPLQSETSFFILVNVLDFFCTYMLLNFGAIEANPIADFFFSRFGFRGMLFFKLASVALICLLAQAIARRSMAKARFVLVAGIVIVGLVVAYSAVLLRSYLV